MEMDIAIIAIIAVVSTLPYTAFFYFAVKILNTLKVANAGIAK